MGIKGARPQYALSLLSTIRRGGRAELARAEPSDTELRTLRGEPLRESSLCQPRIWILSRIGNPLLPSSSTFAARPRERRKARNSCKRDQNLADCILVFTSPEGIFRPGSDISA